MVSRWRLRYSCLKSRNSATPAGSCHCAALYIDDMDVSISAKKVPGAGSSVATRCAFVGHLTNAENTAAVIALLASMAVEYAEVSADTIRKQCPTDRMRQSGHHQLLMNLGGCSDWRQHWRGKPGGGRGPQYGGRGG